MKVILLGFCLFLFSCNSDTRCRNHKTIKSIPKTNYRTITIEFEDKTRVDLYTPRDIFVGKIMCVDNLKLYKREQR